ncbi:MAG: SAM-dependent methyltransferase [Deltaproteobacteria bacterium]|nr:MAG: SAM-dependent methyltransferase [Deltaproteobacteria bacterium]
MVSFGRGVGVSDDHRDAHARDLLPFPWGAALGALDAGGRTRPMLRIAARALSAGLVDHVALRMAAIDELVRAAVTGGATQLVILGAGLDARPWRMAELTPTQIFEVDHPATQSYKRARIGDKPALSRSHVFVPVDFERDDLGERLDALGFDPALPTHWLWEAVTMYLGPEAIELTLQEIGERSAAGSRLSLTYMRPEFLALGHVSRVLAARAFSLLGEPLVGAMATDVLGARLGAAGYELTSDTDSADWARRHGVSPRVPTVFRAERLATAERRG